MSFTSVGHFPISLSGTGNDKSDEYFNRIMYGVGHRRNIYVMCEAIHSHPQTAIKIKHSEAGVVHK